MAGHPRLWFAAVKKVTRKTWVAGSVLLCAGNDTHGGEVHSFGCLASDAKGFNPHASHAVRGRATPFAAGALALAGPARRLAAESDQVDVSRCKLSRQDIGFLRGGLNCGTARPSRDQWHCAREAVPKKDSCPFTHNPFFSIEGMAMFKHGYGHHGIFRRRARCWRGARTAAGCTDRVNHPGPFPCRERCAERE